MKLLRAMALTLIFSTAFFSQAALTPEAPKLKVWFTLKPGKTTGNIATVFVKNEGTSALTKVDATIRLQATNEKIRQDVNKTLNLPRNGEMHFEIPVGLSDSEDGFGSMKPLNEPVAKISVIIRDSVFSSSL